MHSAWLRNTFLRFLKFLQIKEGDLIFWGTNSAESLNYLVPPLPPPFCINFKSFKDPNSSSSIRFQCILLDWIGFCMIQQYFFRFSYFFFWNSVGEPNLLGKNHVYFILNVCVSCLYTDIQICGYIYIYTCICIFVYIYVYR